MNGAVDEVRAMNRLALTALGVFLTSCLSQEPPHAGGWAATAAGLDGLEGFEFKVNT